MTDVDVAAIKDHVDEYSTDFCASCNEKMLVLMKPIHERQELGKIPFPWDVTRMTAFAVSGTCVDCRRRVLRRWKKHNAK